MNLFHKKNKIERFQKRRKKKMNELNRELLRGRYIINLQPKQSLLSGRINHAEVLVRYRRHGKVNLPETFLQELEDLDLIYMIDLYVYELTCKLIYTWKIKRHAYVHLSCNLSRITLHQSDIVKQLNVIRERYGIQPSDIEIEITETTEYKDNPIYEYVGKQLHEAGYRLTLDDFGIGYSNLVFLSRLPFTCIKMDKSIVWELEKSTKMTILLAQMISSCHQIGLEVVAEGVETQGQKDVLKEMGCDYIQGYYIDKPLSCADFESFYLEVENPMQMHTSLRR